MKSQVAILASLSLNVLLGVLLLGGWTRTNSDGPTDPAEPAASTAEIDRPETVDEKPSAPPVIPLPRPFDWSQLHTDSWTAYRDDLRSIGCPNATIRNILRPLIRRHFAEQRRKLFTPWIPHFWELGCPPRADWSRLQASADAIDRLERAALREFTKGGDVTTLSPALSPELDSQLAFLSDDKREQVRDILNQFKVERLNQWRLAFGRTAQTTNPQPISPEDLESQKEGRLATILSPEELDQLKLRQSNHASIRELDSVDLTEDEVAKIIRIQEKAQENPPETASAMASARTDEEKEIEKLLGPERARQLKLAEDPDYPRAREVAAYLGDPDQKAIQLLAIQSQFADMGERMAVPPDGGTPPTPEELDSAREAIRKSLLEQVAQWAGSPETAALWEYLNKDWLDEHFKAPDEPDPWDDPPDLKP
jgi:hypothetical protein